MKKLLLLVLLLVPYPVLAATYYVGPSGNDAANSCVTAQSPTATNRKFSIAGPAGGISCLVSGDILLVADSTYSEYINGNTIPNGTAVALTRIRGESGFSRLAVLSPASVPYAVPIISFTGARSYVEISGFTINCNQVQDNDCITFNGTSTVANPTFITITNNTIQNATRMPTSPVDATSCISTAANGHSYNGSTFHTFSGNTITNCGYAGWGYGIYLSSSDNTVSGNIISKTQGYCVQIYNNPAGVSRNTIARNSMQNCGNTLNGTAGVLLSGGPGHVLVNNLIFRGCDGVQVNYGASTALIANNTFAFNTNCPNPTFHIYPGVTGTAVTNNISYMNTDNTVFDEGSGTTQTTNLITTNPLFTSGATNDYTLTAPSPARDTGTNIANPTDDYLGHARPVNVIYDRGAYEYDVPSTCTFTVQTPLSGSRQRLPATVNTQWTAATGCSGTVKLTYSFDNFVTSFTIATAVAYNAGVSAPFYTFTPDWPSAAAMQIRICQEPALTNCGTSPTFSVAGPYFR